MDLVHAEQKPMSNGTIGHGFIRITGNGFSQVPSDLPAIMILFSPNAIVQDVFSELGFLSHTERL